jgi:RNA processing factor Prp31
MFIEKSQILTCFTNFHLIIRAIFIIVEKDKELLIFLEKINNFFWFSIDFFFLSDSTYENLNYVTLICNTFD